VIPLGSLGSLGERATVPRFVVTIIKVFDNPVSVANPKYY